MKHEFKNSEQFLKGLTKDKNPFKVPSNYFDNTSKEVSNAIFLEDLPKQTGLKIPEGYIENFSCKTPSTKIIPLYKYIAIAAVVCFGIFIFGSKSNNIEVADIASLDESEVIAYLSEGALDIGEILENSLSENYLYCYVDITFEEASEYIDIDDFELELIN